MKRFCRWCIGCRPCLWFIRNKLPHIRFSCGYTRLDGSKYREGYTILRPGLIILSTDENRLSTKLTPGKWGHVSICVAKGGEYEVGEMTADGYTKSDFYDICRMADRVAIAECTDWDYEYRQAVVETCKGLEGVGYNFLFDSMVWDKLYCSQIIPRCDFERRLQHPMTKTLLGDIVTPDDIYNSDNLNILWDSDE